MNILSRLFGSAARVKILRLFLFNSTEAFSPDEISKRSKVGKPIVRKELTMLKNIGLIRKKSYYKLIPSKKGKSEVKKRTAGWTLDERFPYLAVLQHFLIEATPLKQHEILKKLQGIGKLKLVVISGVFIQDWDTSRVDILIVGDKLKRSAVESSIKDIEAEVGRELRFAVFPTSDFKYRINIYDKLVRDILDYPHQKIVDRIGIEPRP